VQTADVLELRSLTPDDWPTWRKLRLQALREAPYAFGSLLADWQGEGDTETRWRARLSIPGSYNVVAVVDGEPAGMASGVPAEQDGTVELISMWVAPVARGCGVGDRLLQDVERWAREGRASILRLAVVQDNETATELYRRNGFRYTGELGELMPDGVRQELIMTKRLSAAER